MPQTLAPLLSFLLILLIFQTIDTVKPVWRTPVTSVRKNANATARTQRASNPLLSNAYAENPDQKPYYTRPEDYKVPDYRPVKPNSPNKVHPGFVPQFLPSKQQFQPQFGQGFKPPPSQGTGPSPINSFFPHYNGQKYPSPPFHLPHPGFSPVDNVKQQIYNPSNALPHWEGVGPLPPQGAYGPVPSTAQKPMRPSATPENYFGQIPMQPSVNPVLLSTVGQQVHVSSLVPSSQSAAAWYKTTNTVPQDFSPSHLSDMPAIFVSQSNPFSMPTTSFTEMTSTNMETMPSLETDSDTSYFEDITRSFTTEGPTPSNLTAIVVATSTPEVILGTQNIPKASVISGDVQEYLENIPSSDRSGAIFVEPDSLDLEQAKALYFPRPALSQVYQPPGHQPEDFSQHIDVNFLKPNRTCVGPICGIDTDKVSLYKPEKGDGSRGPTLLISNAAKGDAARLGYIPPPPKLISEFPLPPTSTAYYSDRLVPGGIVYPQAAVPGDFYPGEVPEPYHPEIPKGPHIFMPPQVFPAPPPPTQVPPAQMTVETESVPSYYPTAKTIATSPVPQYSRPSASPMVPASTLQTTTASPYTFPPFESTPTYVELIPETTTKLPQWSVTETLPPPPSTHWSATYNATPPSSTITTAEKSTTVVPTYPTAPSEVTMSTTLPSTYVTLTLITETTPTTRVSTSAASTSAQRSTTETYYTSTSPPETSTRQAFMTTEYLTTSSHLPTTIHAGLNITTPKPGVLNRIRGKVHVVCKEDGIEFSATTLFPFTGQIFANNRKRIPRSKSMPGIAAKLKETWSKDRISFDLQGWAPTWCYDLEARLSCLHNIVNAVAPKVFLPFVDCGTKNTGDQQDNRAQYHMQVIVVIQQSDGTSTVQSFMAQCVHQKVHYDKQTLPRRIEEALEELQLVATKLEQKAPLPQVEMKIVIDEHHQLGPVVSEVDIGMPLAVQWRLIPESDAYGFHVKNCIVMDDISNVEHKMIDELGCSTDLSIFAHPHYDTYHDTASSHLWAFKVPDHTRLRIRCDLSICSDIPSSSTNISSCGSIPSPPFCPDLITSPPNSILYDAEGAFLKRRRHIEHGVTQTVRATLCTGPSCGSQPLRHEKRCFDLHWVAASTGLSFATLVAAVIIYIAVKVKVSRQK